jgi:hypothetical protein
MGLLSMASVSQEYEVNPWPDKLHLKLCHMTTDGGNAISSCFTERMFKTGTD